MIVFVGVAIFIFDVVVFAHGWFGYVTHQIVKRIGNCRGYLIFVVAVFSYHIMTFPVVTVIIKFIFVSFFFFTIRCCCGLIIILSYG